MASNIECKIRTSNVHITNLHFNIRVVIMIQTMQHIEYSLFYSYCFKNVENINKKDNFETK